MHVCDVCCLWASKKPDRNKLEVYLHLCFKDQKGSVNAKGNKR